MLVDLVGLQRRVRTASEMMEAFSDEAECRRILEAMVWPDGRYCPDCGSLRSTALAGRDTGRKARPGLLPVRRAGVPQPVYCDHPDTAAFDQAQAVGLVEGTVVLATDGQGHVVAALGRAGRRDPAHRLAYGAYHPPDDGDGG